jgi:outer membrane protein OmpA-like peptidoglycan-associated protein
VNDRQHRALWPLVLLATVMGAGCAMPEPPPPRTAEPSAARQEAPQLAVIVSEADIESRRQALASTDDAVDPDAVGYFMDVFRARVRRDLADTGIAVDYRDRSIVVTFPSQIGFEFGSAQLTTEAASLIDLLGTILGEYRATLIVISGHTDDVGDPDYNRRLSEARARSVARHLATMGINQSRLMVRGFGSDRPVAENASEEGRARNRRVELMLELLVRDRIPQPETAENA